MIHEFTGRGRIFWFPKAWANSVVRWICGVFSPSGTIQVTNNLSPDGEGSLALDVNVNAVAKQIAEMRDDREITQGRVESTTHIVRGLLDGQSVNFDGEHVSVNRDWVADIAKEAVGDASECDCAEKWASFASDVQAAKDSAAEAESSAEAAKASETAATNAADAATIEASAAEESATSAEESATSAEEHSTSAQTSLTEAEAAADAASVSAEEAAASAEEAAASAEEAKKAVKDAVSADDLNTLKSRVEAVTVSNGKSYAVPLTALTGNINGHSGTCYVTINDDGSLGHSENKAYTLLENARISAGSKLLTDADLSGTEIDELKEAAEKITTLNETVDDMKTTVEEAKTNAADAKTAADAAGASADEAKNKADTANTKIDAVTTTSSGGSVKVPLSALTGNIGGHSGTCLVTIGDDGSLGHTNKNGRDIELLSSAADVADATKLLTDKDLSDDDVKNLDNIATAAADGMVTQDIAVCTGIAWQYVQSAGGYALVFTTQTLKFKSGLLVEVGTETSTYNEYDGKAS